MSYPSDPSYDSAVKWAEQIQGNKNNNDLSFWILLLFIIALIVGAYFWIRSIYTPKPDTGAMSNLKPEIKPPPMILDAQGNIRVL